MQRHLVDYMRRPDSMGPQAITQLESMVCEYPYFHSARILLLQALYRQHSPQFNEQLRKSSVLLPDRRAVFHLVEEPNYSKVEERRKYVGGVYTEDKSQLTSDVIRDFLEQQPVSEGRRNHRIDATQDYIGYLMQNEEQNSQQERDIPLNGGGAVEEFLQDDTHRIVLRDTTSDAVPQNLTENDDNSSSNEILTEVMAGIYIKQGKFGNAIKILRQLSLKYPKKNRYFADQIRFLEKIILNNKNK